MNHPPVPRPAPTHRAALIFAVLGMVVALVAGGVYLYRGSQTPEPARRTPEATVAEFLAGVFLAASPQRVAPVVCAGWDPAEAITRTSAQIEAGVSVSWDRIEVATRAQRRATLRARLGLRLRDDVRPSRFQQWRFTVVDEDGWRVCDAGPFPT